MNLKFFQVRLWLRISVSATLKTIHHVPTRQRILNKYILEAELARVHVHPSRGKQLVRDGKLRSKRLAPVEQQLDLALGVIRTVEPEKITGHTNDNRGRT